MAIYAPMRKRAFYSNWLESVSVCGVRVKKTQTYRVCFSEKLVGLGSRSSDACVDFCLIPGFASNLTRVSI